MNINKVAMPYGIIGLPFGNLIFLANTAYAGVYDSNSIINPRDRHVTRQLLSGTINTPGTSQGNGQ